MTWFTVALLSTDTAHHPIARIAELLPWNVTLQAADSAPAAESAPAE
jgi:hypothetical protein